MVLKELLPALQLLDLLVELVAERLLVLDLAGERAQLLLLALQHLELQSFENFV